VWTAVEPGAGQLITIGQSYSVLGVGFGDAAAQVTMEPILEQDAELIKWLNLVYSSPQFVIWIEKENSNPVVKSLKHIPKNNGEYWVSGNSILASGKKIPSIFIVDSNSGGSLKATYWSIGKTWYEIQDRPAVLLALGLNSLEVFPFDWELEIPLEDDIFH